MNLNKLHLIGRVTKDPELKTLDSGMSVVKFGLATNNVYTNKNGEKIEETDFHNITAWGKTAETIAQYVIKGQELYVEGRIQYRSWDKQDGSKGYATDIICATFQFGQKSKGVDTSTAPAPVEKPLITQEEIPVIESEKPDKEPDEGPDREPNIPF